MSSTAATTTTFSPFSTTISPSFWHALTSLKLKVLKLSDEPIPINATYSKGRTVKDRKTGEDVGLGCLVELDERSFDKSTPAPSTSTTAIPPASIDRITLPGLLINFNTIEDFKNSDKPALLDKLGTEIWEKITSGSGSTAEELNPFLMLTFADLKKYKYYYWCGFPALLSKPGWETVGEWGEVHGEEIDAIREFQKENGGSTAATLAKPSATGSGLEFAPLSSFPTFYDSVPPSSRTLIFLDPSSTPTSPGWPLRNILSYLSHATPNDSNRMTELRVISYRDTAEESGVVGTGKSRVAVLRLKDGGVAAEGEEGKKPSVVGWEKNDKGKLGPRVADLAPLMDPTRLADQAVDLNLQLMRWRIMPSLNLEKVSSTKVLLLGAGTLGCYVARTLMAWGVSKITLVDSSTVSFSNPVRQPLFEFEDSLNGGKPKAECAAASLKKIYPGVDATGVMLNIPMPGHPIAPALMDKTKEEVKKLEELIESHDVVYLLMDSRESRWLPTVIGASMKKLVMNVALGFDTFLVMRHGVASENDDENVPVVVPGAPYTGKLGCYYCNDIVAPMDSLTDRTLDQMCTVTRPGIASIASSTAVELMVSLLQHPKGASAPSDIPVVSAGSQNQQPPEQDPSTSSPLGIVPHQIRGMLAQFHNMKMTGQASNLCTGCSSTVVKAYEKGGFEMLLQAFDDAKYLEKLTGLDKLYAESEEMMESVDWDEEDEDE
ncbi:autophagy-related protein 7 [Pseudohyphozyma bogoriensis]|nr:autophagy-related protein 7 [Pseudohyphozyma bogoriensis]